MNLSLLMQTRDTVQLRLCREQTESPALVKLPLWTETLVKLKKQNKSPTIPQFKKVMEKIEVRNKRCQGRKGGRLTAVISTQEQAWAGRSHGRTP